MSNWQVAFLRAAFGWLIATAALGVVVSIWPALAAPFRPTHAHMGILGFFLGMVMGVAFWMLPRPGGIKQQGWEATTFLLLQAGLLLRVGCEPWWRATLDPVARIGFIGSGLILLAAMIVFAIAMSRRVVTIAVIREKGLGKRRPASPREKFGGDV